MLHQLWCEVVVEQVDEAAESFGGTIPASGLKQQLHQGIIHMLTTGVSLFEHAADHPWSGRIAEQGGAQPSLAHHGFQQWPDPGHPGGLCRQLLVVHQALGAIDQHNATAAVAQQLCCPQGHHPADRVAHQQHRPIDHGPAEVRHLLPPQIKSVEDGPWLLRFVLQSRPRLVAAAEAEQVDGVGRSQRSQGRLIETPVPCVGAETVDQQHGQGCLGIPHQRPSDVAIPPAPQTFLHRHAWNDLGGAGKRNERTTQRRRLVLNI